MEDLSGKYDFFLEKASGLFIKEINDYGANWRVYRRISALDKLFIKAERIRTIIDKGAQKVTGIGNDISDEFIGIINYSAVGIVQFKIGAISTSDKEIHRAVELYKESIHTAKEEFCNLLVSICELENMRIEILNDCILQNILILKNDIDCGSNKYIPIFSEILNYAVFSLIIQEKSKDH